MGICLGKKYYRSTLLIDKPRRFKDSVKKGHKTVKTSVNNSVKSVENKYNNMKIRKKRRQTKNKIVNG